MAKTIDGRRAPEWAKHLRWAKRVFWRGLRREQARDARDAGQRAMARRDTRSGTPGDRDET